MANYCKQSHHIGISSVNRESAVANDLFVNVQYNVTFVQTTLPRCVKTCALTLQMAHTLPEPTSLRPVPTIFLTTSSVFCSSVPKCHDTTVSNTTILCQFYCVFKSTFTRWTTHSLHFCLEVASEFYSKLLVL